MLNFNGKDIPSFVRVKAIDIDVLPVTTSNVLNVGGGYGCIDGVSSFGEKNISVDVSVVIPKGETLQSCARQLAVWVRGNNFKTSPLIIQDDPTVLYMAKVGSDVSLKDLICAGEGSIEFVVPSGLSEGVTPRVFTGEKQAEVINEGTTKTYPVITVTIGTTITNGVLNIYNSNTGDRVLLNGTFNVGDIIEVNCSKNLVKVNGNLSMNMINLNTKFFSVDEGNTLIKCDNASSVKVEITERYI